MSFLAPLMLAALPLAALPLIIHLINQRRFQTIDWGAMKFLLEANRMSRGYARIRQWLILLLRVAAVAALVLVISRPLATGWVGLTAGQRADTTLILLDRSASMRQTGSGGGPSKLEAGLQQLVNALDTLGSSRWVFIDSASLTPREIESPALLPEAAAGAVDASADLPALLQAAYEYVKENRTGQTEIWICSDLRANDWNAASGRWQTLRESFLELPQGVRFHLLAYPEQAAGDLSIRVSEVRRQRSSDGVALLVSLAVARQSGEGKLTVPVRLEVDGARSELTIELEGDMVAVKDYVVPLASDRAEGWGVVSIPADLNPANNRFYFVFAEPAPRLTLLAADGGAETRPLELAASISANPAAQGEVVRVDRAQLATAPWEDAALLVWQSPLPVGKDAELVRSFVEQGGQAIFLPPANVSDAALFGVKWTDWREPSEPTVVDSWRGDHDLWARTASGAALPIGELAIRRYAGIDGEHTPLATLRDGAPLLVRATTRQGGAYFLAVTTTVRDSNLAVNGVAFYAAVQRALTAGAARLAGARQLVAGEAKVEAANWRRLAGDDGALSTEYGAQGGVYADEERLRAVNRAAAEDHAAVLGKAQVAGLFEGLPFDRVDDQLGSAHSLMREIWRMFLIGMIGAMIVEAGLSLPKRPRTAGELA